jgi:hypothetical protein
VMPAKSSARDRGKDALKVNHSFLVSTKDLS